MPDYVLTRGDEGFLAPVGGDIGGQVILTTDPRPYAVQLGGIGLRADKLGRFLSRTPFEVRNGYKERFGPDGEQEVVVRMATPWKTRKGWIDEMLGYSTTVVVAGTPTLLRTIPAQCPELGYEHLYCAEVSLAETQGIFARAAIVPNDNLGNPLVRDDGGPFFADWPAWYAQQGINNGSGWAEYDVTFRSRPYEVRTDEENATMTQGELERYVERRTRASVKGTPLPAGTLKFTDGSGAIPTSAAVAIVTLEELHYIWYEVPDYPATAVANCVGKMNQDDFDGARGYPSYPAGTLLFNGVIERDRYRHTTGRIFWRIHYSFIYFPNGVNYYLNNQGDYVLATRDGTDDGVFGGSKGLIKNADFNQLFEPPLPTPYQ